MVIDGFTVAAQAVNFIILVLLLRHFLFQPVLDAIDAREKRIADQLEAAATTQAEATRKQTELDEKNAAFEQHRQARLSEVEEAAEVEHARLLEAARASADGLSETRHRVLVQESLRLREAMGNRVVEEVFAISRQVLADLGGASLEERIAAVFIERLSALDEPARTALAQAIATSPDGAVLRSAFDLPQGQRASIQRALDETLSAEVEVRFETTPALVSGIELTSNGQKLGWSVASYLGSLERGVAELYTDGEAADHGA